MTIRDRLEDAEFLYQNGRRDGAFLSILVATAATSRRRHTKSEEPTDKSAFTRFLLDELQILTGGAVTDKLEIDVPSANKKQYPEGFVPLQDILYLYVRCALAHEAAISSKVEFVEGTGAGWTIDSSGDTLVLTDSFMVNMHKAIRFAPENNDLFPDIASIPDDVVGWILFGIRRESEAAIQYMSNRSLRKAETPS